jgi:hypothetical protein
LRLLGDRHLAAAIASRAREVLPEFDIDAMVRAQERLYLALIQGRQPEAGEGDARSGGPAINNNNEAVVPGPGGGEVIAKPADAAVTH